MKTHGMHNTNTYHVWENIKQRCLNTNHPSFKDYGERGITICDRWRSFENFLEDMGEQPVGLTIERDNNEKGYCKENCLWVTRKEQQGNRRNSHAITYNGKTQVIEDWAKECGFGSSSVITGRLKLGWSIEKALTTPSRKVKRKCEWRTQLQT